MVFWLNGQLVTASQATLHCAAAGTLLGWGVFTTLGIWNGQPFALDRHLARLRRDAARLEVPIDYADDVLEVALFDLLARNGIADGIARLTATRRGDGRWHCASGGDFSMMAMPRDTSGEIVSTHNTADAETRPGAAASTASGIALRLALSPYRIEARRALAGVKTTSYGDYQMAWREAMRRGFDEAALCNSRGALCECARANLFWVRDGELRTPALQTGCLPGIAREIVCEWATEEGVALREGVFAPLELLAADEVFVTSASHGPRTVASFAGDVLAAAGDEENEEQDEGQNRSPGATTSRGFVAPGPVTARLQARWRMAVAPGEASK